MADPAAVAAAAVVDLGINVAALLVDRVVLNQVIVQLGARTAARPSAWETDGIVEPS